MTDQARWRLRRIEQATAELKLERPLTIEAIQQLVDEIAKLKREQAQAVAEARLEEGDWFFKHSQFPQLMLERLEHLRQLAEVKGQGLQAP